MVKFEITVGGNSIIETEKAIGLRMVTGELRKDCGISWFPKSRIEIDRTNEFGWVRIIIPAWLLRDRLYRSVCFDGENGIKRV